MSNQIVKALENGAEKLGKTIGEDAGKAVKDLYHDTGTRLKKVAENHVENDARHAAEMEKILKGGGKEDLPQTPHGRRGGGTGRGEEPSMAGASRGGQSSEGNGSCTTGGDPVDVVSGQMIMSTTDLELPGLLPLVLRRSYASGYRADRHFGPGWSSTLDQRVQIDSQAIHYAGDDGQILHYPRPTIPDRPVLPEHGARWPLTWDDTTGAIRIEDPATGWTRHFDAPSDGAAATRPITALTDRNNHRITYTHDSDGLPSAVEHSGGYRVVVDMLHTGAGPRVEALRLLDGTNSGLGTTVITYRYDAFGRLTDIVNSSGLPLVYTHDADDRITSWTDRNGHWYEYEYGPDGRVIRGVGSGGALEALFDYDLDNQVTTVTDSLGHRTEHHYDEHGHITTTVDPVGNTVHTEHDRYGRLLSHTDALGRTTRHTLDAQGDPVRIDRPDGTSVSVQYNELRLPLRVEAPDGAIWRQTYDSHGNRTELTDPTGATTRFGYDEVGHLSAVTDPLGATTRVVCDAAGLPMEVTDPAAAVTRTERDAFGRPLRITDPVGGVTHFEWHADGQLARRTGPEGATESWTWDGEGNLLTRTDASGGVSRFEYTHFDLPLARTRPDGARFEFEHDTELRLTRVRNAQGLTWTYEYDAVGNIVSETDFGDRTLSYEVDPAGQLATRRDGQGGTISFERDWLGRVVRKDVDGRVTTYGYDRAGRLLEACGPDGELRYRYDRRGLTEAEIVDGRPILYSYDVLGRRTRRTTPTGHVTSYAYGADGLPDRLTSGDQQIDFTHDTAGRELTRVFGDAITMTSAWDQAGRLSAQHITAGTRAVNSRAYSYRADGHLTSVADGLSGTRTFDLDQAGRVTAVRAQGWTEQYAYDDAGNQTSASWPSGHPVGREATGPRTYVGTTITRAGDVRFEHDALGRVTLRQKTRLSRKPDTWRYEWDTENRLTSVTTPDGTRWRYRYDPLGRRTAKQRLTDGGESVAEEIRFTWDGLTLCEQTTHGPDDPHTVALTWDHRDVVPLTQTERILTADDRQEEVDRRFFAIATDLIGTPTELIDESGDIAWRTRPTLWGATAWARDSSTYTPLRFPGQYFDPETGLHYNCFRYYDPETGRYTSPDPLGLAPAPNPVGYVDNPNSEYDPLGLMPKCTKEEKAQKRIDKIVDDVLARAQNGELKKHADYHGDTGHGFTDERVLEILKKPDAVYQSSGQAGNFIFRKDNDIAVVYGPGAKQGQAITAYGESGIKGESGARALGGSPSDPGKPVTHEDIVEGRIPGKFGNLAPGVQIR